MFQKQNYILLFLMTLTGVLLGLLPTHLLAQQYSFRVFSLDKGLPQSEVADIYQDKRGALWVATNGGVSRFGGTNFQTFATENGLADNHVKKIFEDNKKNMWFITQNGASSYNGKIFKNYTKKQGFPDGESFQYYQEQNGKTWVFARREQGNSKIVYSTDHENFIDFSSQYLPLTQNNFVEGILGTASHGLLIATNSLLYEYNGDDLTISSIQNLPELAGKKLKPILEDAQKRIWLLAKDKNNITKMYIYQRGVATTFNIPDNSINLSNFLTIYEDKSANFWFSIEGYGVLKYDQKDFKSFRKANGLPNDFITTIFEDKDKNMWFGTSGSGLVEYIGDKFISFNKADGLNSNFVWAIYQDEDYKYWFGTGSEAFIGGLCSYDGKVVTDNLKNNPTYVKRVKKIHSLGQGKLLLGTLKGLFEWDNGLIRNVDEQYGLPNGVVINNFQETKKGHFWFATQGEGVIHVTPQSKEILTVSNKNIISNLVKYILEDSKGRVWICTQYGISCLENGKITNYTTQNSKLCNDNVVQAVEDHTGSIWFATFGGLARFKDNDFTTFVTARERKTESQKAAHIHYIKEISSNTIYSILLDKKKNIWLGTQRGIDCISLSANGEVTSVKSFGQVDGFLATENNTNASYEDKMGNLWFGTISGVVRYAPDMEKPTNFSPPIYLTKVKLFFKDIKWTESPMNDYNSGVADWNYVPQNLVLPHNQNNISFNFEAFDYQTASKILYQWKLEGLDETLSPPSTSSQADYTNLSAGNYQFKVYININGELSHSHLIYPFEIKAPFWRTTWFYVIATLVVFAVIVAIIRWRIASVERQKEALQMMIEEARAELQTQNEALLQQQDKIATQNKNLAELNGTKDRFFSILAHDIKGPLNSLTAFLSIMTNHLDDMTKDDILFMSGSLNKSVKNLYSLLENVLSWSRSQMGVIEFKNTNVSVRDILVNNIQLLEITAKNKSIKLSMEVKKDILVRADINSINTVIRNLISNALKFTPANGSVTLKTQVVGDFAEISVCDTGVGISQAVQDRIFQIDKRISTKGTENETGTGLGLILCKEFVEKNGGIIRIESEESKGSKFIFTVPLAQVKQKNIEKPVQTLDTPNESTEKEDIKENNEIIMVDEGFINQSENTTDNSPEIENLIP